jgi:hypothetical protein
MSSTGISTVGFKGILKISAMGLLVFGLMGFKSLGDDKTLCAGFLPANNMRIPVGMMTAGGITQQQFDAVLNRVENLYKADIARLGGTLKINHLWTDATVNASATRQGNVWVLNMYGGLARHPATSEEGMALVACHEMGHHMGGAPKISGWFSTWATNEGGADYYAGLKCLRRYFAQDDNKAALASVTLDPGVVETCTKQFSTEADQLICERISLSGDSVAYLFQALRNEANPPKYTTPDKSVVTKMNDDHPATQCRMDTYFAGMTCAASANEANSDTDYHTGACSAPHDNVGVRPLCWFYPGQ